MNKLNLDINEDCKKDDSYSKDLKDGDSCFNCEFCISNRVAIIGGMIGKNTGVYKECEKGYWKEEV